MRIIFIMALTLLSFLSCTYGDPDNAVLTVIGRANYAVDEGAVVNSVLKPAQIITPVSNGVLMSPEKFEMKITEMRFYNDTSSWQVLFSDSLRSAQDLVKSPVIELESPIKGQNYQIILVGYETAWTATVTYNSQTYTFTNQGSGTSYCMFGIDSSIATAKAQETALSSASEFYVIAPYALFGGDRRTVYLYLDTLNTIELVTNMGPVSAVLHNPLMSLEIQ